MLLYFKDLLHDKSLIKKCLIVALPMMLQAFVVSSVTLVDNLMIGQLGDIAISGVSSANRYYQIMNYTILAMIASCIIYLAQYYGANDIKKMKEAFRIAITTSLFLVIIFSLFAIFKADVIVRFIINDDEVVNIGQAYLRICALSYIPMIISNVIGQAMRIFGKHKLPMYISIFSILLNIIGDYILIFGKFGFKEMGVIGAAIATIIARLIEMIIYLFVLKKVSFPFKTRIRDIFKFDKILFKNIIISAIPLILNEFLFSFGQTTILKCYSFKGVTINTAYTIAYTIADLFFVLFSGMASATNVIIGTTLGANKLDEAKEKGYKLLILSCMISIFFGFIMFLSSFMIPMLYQKASIDAIKMAKSFIKTMAFFFIIYTFNTQIYFTLRAGGETKATLYMDSFYMWLVVVPIVYYFSYKTSLNVLLVYIIAQSTDLIKIIFSYHLFKKEKWVKNITI